MYTWGGVLIYVKLVYPRVTWPIFNQQTWNTIISVGVSGIFDRISQQQNNIWDILGLSKNWAIP